MKIYGALLALCASRAAAFQAQTNTFRPTTALHSEARVGESINAPAASVSAAKALEARLAALENGQSQMESPGRELWERATPVKVQGGSLKTWSFTSPSLERVQVVMKTEGRPLDADIELWQGPDNTPAKMRVYVEDGALRQFSAIIETPRQGPNTVAIRNTANLEFPLDAAVAAAGDSPSVRLSEMGKPTLIQGGALRTYPFDPMVESIQILLMTDGRPLNSRIELLQGPNNNKQVIELYTEDGLERPYFSILETPGSGNVVRVVNTATVEFPLTAWVEPFSVASFDEGMDPLIGGDDQGAYLLNRL